MTGLFEAPLKAVLAAEGDDLRTAAPEGAAALRDAGGDLLEGAEQAGEVRDDLDIDDLMALVAGTVTTATRADAGPPRITRLLSVLLGGIRGSGRPCGRS